jgi:hypothetical protein
MKEELAKVKIKKRLDIDVFLEDKAKKVVISSGVVSRQFRLLEEEVLKSEMYGMRLNNWGYLGKKKAFKKIRKKKMSASGLCHKNFRWCKGTNTLTVIGDYEPP